jgi:hypothetical protein
MNNSNDTAPEKLAALQTRFAAHIRDPQLNAAPEGIEDRRMAIYRDLFFNNIKGLLSSNFPVIRSLYSDKDWNKLCRDFYRDYRCHTPLFPELPREFLQYLQDLNPEKQAGLPPFIHELAHYEWVELGLSLDESDPDKIAVNPDGDLLDGIPVLSPLAWPLSYQYPVHKIRKEFQPDQIPPEATHLLVWRKQDFTIHFMQLNSVSQLMLQKLKEEKNQTGLQLLNSISGILKHPNPKIVIQGGKDLLNELKDKEIILGIQR